MNIDDFDFELPQELIANYPLPKRSASRLLHVAGGKLGHYHFHQLAEHLNPGDLLVFNDTKVIPARLYGQKHSGGKVELLVERLMADNQVLAHVKASKAPRVGSKLLIANNVDVEVLGRQGDLFLLQFVDVSSVLDILQEVGHIPLPPYIQRQDELSDKQRYQTIYAKHHGAVAAPTAGLHFDDELMNALQSKGINSAYLTLHVGAGTFQPVRVDNIQDHVMHAELAEVNESVCEQIRQTKAAGKRVVAVGTTCVRSLETAASDGCIKPFHGETDIFIYPGYQFNCVDAMITNFHLPRSTLMMLVSAFAGHQHIMLAYQQAIAERYRFFSYGDAMLLEPGA